MWLCPACSAADSAFCIQYTQLHCVEAPAAPPRLLCTQVRALTLGWPHRNALKELMNKKEIVGDLLNQLRCAHCQLAGRLSRMQILLEVTQALDRIAHIRPQAGHHAPCKPCRLIRQRAAYEGMPAGISRSKITTTLAQLLVLSDHLDQIIGELPIGKGMLTVAISALVPDIICNMQVRCWSRMACTSVSAGATSAVLGSMTSRNSLGRSRSMLTSTPLESATSCATR